MDSRIGAVELRQGYSEKQQDAMSVAVQTMNASFTEQGRKQERILTLMEERFRPANAK